MVAGRPSSVPPTMTGATTTTTTTTGTNAPGRSKSLSQQTSAAQAAASLGLLLREDHLLTRHELHVSGKSEEAAFSYAAALLEEEETSQVVVQQRATDALGEVNRKLALVESLAERVSRTSPEAVAGPLLRLHGYTLDSEEPLVEESQINNNSSGMPTTLAATRERCDRLKRQGEVLEGVSRRVESSLQRGLKRIETATSRLSRVLSLSATLKMILRLQFESSKLQGYVLEDLRDLTRAAASVAVIEDLLSRPELKEGPKIDVVEAMRPKAETTAAAVRKAAASLLSQHHHNTTTGSSAVVQLGATLQVYYHLGELPQAAWSAVEHGLSAAEKASAEFWNATTLSRLAETATSEARVSLGSSAGGKKPGDAAMQRALKKKLRELRAEAASKWASGIADASLQVWNLHRVLCRKSDPVSRQVFIDVVSHAPLPERFKGFRKKGTEFSIFSLYWDRMCESLGGRLNGILDQDGGKLIADVAALYPAVRAAALDMLGSLYDTMQAGQGSLALEDAAHSSSAAGILGGSSGLDDPFLHWTTMAEKSGPASTLGVASVDTWTRSDNLSGDNVGSSERLLSSATTTSMSSVFQSPEWKRLQGSPVSGGGLAPLERAFQESSRERLCAPLQYLFPANVSVDEDGVALSSLPLLPSKYDVQKFDENIKQELSLADPREGGGDLTAVTMIAESVIDMVSKFCDQAKNACSNVGEDGYLNPDDGSATEALSHDIKVAVIMSILATSLRNAPENTFIAPYRPATSPQHEDAASMCQIALVPALHEIEKMVKTLILGPFCRALNRRVASAIACMHHGAYMEEAVNDIDDTGPSFVQKYLSGLFESISSQHLSHLPEEYASIVASSVATFSIYAFVSNVTLVRPLGESARLRITQDLADFELALEQLMLRGERSISLSQMDNGKPYAELRALRQMLFWNGLRDEKRSAAMVAKTLLREVWAKDVRPSTVCHYLFSFAPSLLSSPHHAKRMNVEDYVATILTLDGDIEDGEAGAWMTTMACCDSYQQRESVDHSKGGGDSRVPAILMTLGPELLRRRRQ